MSDKTGGSAFPVSASWTPSGEIYHCGDNGMTLRDYFAAQAVGGIFANPHGWPDRNDASEIASRCYAIADAMLTERTRATTP